MKIQLNGLEKKCSNNQNLRQIIEGFTKDSTRVIAEVNGEIVKYPQWDNKVIRDGDTIELVSFVGGG